MPSHDVFISYARADGYKAASQIEAALNRERLSCWRDERDLNPALDFTAELETAIEECLAVVVCITPGARRDDTYVRREIVYAQLCEKPIAVARFAKIKPPISVVTNSFFEVWQDEVEALTKLAKFCGDPAKYGQPSALDASKRNRYLRAIYHDIVETLKDRIVLPDLGEELNLIDLPGTVTSTGSSRVLSTRFGGRAQRIRSISMSELQSSPERRVGIIGGPGAGKTITLLALARDMASSALALDTSPVPLVLPAVTAVAEDGTVCDLRTWLSAHVPILGADGEELLESGQAILLVDGLDEFPQRSRDQEAGQERLLGD